MQALIAIVSLALFVSLAAVALPFRPFGRRKNAVISSVVTFSMLVTLATMDNQVESSQSSVVDIATPQQNRSKNTSAGSSSERLARINMMLDQGKLWEAATELKSLRYRLASEDKESHQITLVRFANATIDDVFADIEDTAEKQAAIVSFLDANFLRAVNEVGREDAFLAEFERRTLEYVQKVPASNSEANQIGYSLLARINPKEDSYAAKRDDYQRKRAEVALSGFRKEYDKIEGTTFYEHASFPRYTNSRSTVKLYIGIKGANSWLRMKTIYAAENWLFVDRVIAYFDGKTGILTAGDFDRDNNSTIWEWRDEAPTPAQLGLLRQLSAADDATLRFEGTQYRKDVQLTKADKKALSETLDAYLVLEGFE